MSPPQADPPLGAALAALQRDLMDLRERLARVEIRQEAVSANGARSAAELDELDRRLDEVRRGLAEGAGAVRLGLWLGHALAAVAGFIAAHLWPPR